MEQIQIREEEIAASIVPRSLDAEDNTITKNKSSPSVVDGIVVGTTVAAAAAGATAAGAAAGITATRSSPNIIQSDNNNGVSQEKFTAISKENKDLKEQYAKLRVELEQQQVVTEQVRQEASAFLEEMRTLAESESSWSSEKQSREIESLKKEVQEWKTRYSKSKAQVRNLRASTYGSSPFPHQQVAVDSTYLSSSGRILDVNVTKFQLAMDDFLVKARTTSPKYLMDHLHNVVTATRVITQDVSSNYNGDINKDITNTNGSATTTPAINSSDANGKGSKDSDLLQSEIAQATSLVSATATHLITTTRNHSTSGGLSPMFLVDAAATDLASSVIDLIRLAKVRPTSTLPSPTKSNGNNSVSSNINEHHYSSSTAGSIPNTPNVSGHSRQASSSQLSRGHGRTHSRTQSSSHHLQSQSISSPSGVYRNPLDSPQSSHSHSHSRQISDYSTSSINGNNNLNGASSSTINGGSSQRHVRTTPSTSFDFMNSNVSPIKRSTSNGTFHTDNNIDQHSFQNNYSSQHQAPSSSSSQMQEQSNLQQYASKPMTYSTSNISTIMVDPEKKTVAELQEYLESQTVSVIDSIQDLLTGIKGNATYFEVRANVSLITSTVQPVIDATHKSMTQTRNWRLKDLGKYIVDSLESCCERMSALYADSSVFDDHMIPDRQFKQRLAGISFDMARCTKELVKTVEEVSLKMEISQIDHELEHQ